MELAELLRLNELWGPVCPYLARHGQEILPPDTKDFVELGPFSGGITWVFPPKFFSRQILRLAGRARDFQFYSVF